jgi:hypothetical protein
MIVNGVVSASDLQDGATLAEILDDDGSGLDVMGSAEKVDSFAIVNEVTPLRVDLSLVPWATMWHFPLETTSPCPRLAMREAIKALLP